MRFFSKDYTPCVTRAAGWCNIPNKAKFNPTEQMIVAYHKETGLYAYKGLFNRNIDYNWSGAILLDFAKIIDKCTACSGIQREPAPSNDIIIGLTIDTWTPYTRQTVTHTRVHLQVLLIVDGRIVSCHHLFQEANCMYK